MNDYLQDSFIEIQLSQDTAFLAGQQLHGKVIVFAQKNLNNVSRISLTFFGQESIQQDSQQNQDLNSPEIQKEQIIIDHCFTLYDFNEHLNVIQHGAFSFPFQITLPEWLPQSNVYFRPINQKNHENQKFEVYRVFYNLQAKIEGTLKANLQNGCIEGLQFIQRITLISPQFSQCNEWLEQYAGDYLSSTFYKKGSFDILGKLNKDTFYPRDQLQLYTYLNNTQSQLDVDKYVFQITRKILISDPIKKKIIQESDEVIFQEILNTICKKNEYEERMISVYIPESIIFETEDNQQQKLIQHLIKNNIMDDSEKALTYNLASSIQCKIFSIEYYAKLTIKHQGSYAKINENGHQNNQMIFPIKLMAQTKKTIIKYKSKMKNHPNWHAYEYVCKCFGISEEYENEFLPYSIFRKREINYLKQQYQPAQLYQVLTVENYKNENFEVINNQNNDFVQYDDFICNQFLDSNNDY